MTTAAAASVCLFCGSAPGNRAEFRAAAEDFGRAVARRGATLVYGGARRGIMGFAADAALAAGGRVVGVIPKAIVDLEVAHYGLTTLHVVEDMHARKALMTALSDGFVALPGGYGTLDELFEALTWAQLGIHRKPAALLNVAGYFDGLAAFLDRAASDGLLRAADRAYLRIADTADASLDIALGSRNPPAAPKVTPPPIGT